MRQTGRVPRSCMMDSTALVCEGLRSREDKTGSFFDLWIGMDGLEGLR